MKLQTRANQNTKRSSKALLSVQGAKQEKSWPTNQERTQTKHTHTLAPCAWTSDSSSTAFFFSFHNKITNNLCGYFLFSFLHTHELQLNLISFCMTSLYTVAKVSVSTVYGLEKMKTTLTRKINQA